MSLNNEKNLDQHAEHAPQLLTDHSAGTSVNANQKLYNPLAGVPKQTLFNDVERFCAQSGLNEELDVFKRGALIAQSPSDFESIEELTEEDRFWLRKAAKSRWSHPRMLYFAGE